jgi:HK97 family phage portal protein
MSTELSLLELFAAQNATGSMWPPYQRHRGDELPSVGKCLTVYQNLLGQMPMEAYRGIDPLPRPRLLHKPDPQRNRFWFIARHAADYLLNGNAVHYVTSRDADNWPKTVVWLPASRVTLEPRQGNTLLRPVYRFDGRELRDADVVHTMRGCDPLFPWRGVGVLEQHFGSLSRIWDEEAYEASMLREAAMPSVAVIAPNSQLSDAEIDAAVDKWWEKYAGPGRRPGIFPHGTEVKPLAWSPSDAQFNEARKMSLQDTANLFGLDGYWVGAEAPSHTYRSPGPMFTQLLRISLEGVIQPLEQDWSDAWLPHGQTLRFTRRSIEQDSPGEAVRTVAMAVKTTGPDGTPLMTVDEGRAALGLAVHVGAGAGPSVPSPLPNTDDGDQP